MKRLHSKRGFATLAVLGLMLMIVIYLVTVRGAVELTVSQARRTARRQETAEIMAAAVTEALASPAAPPAKDYTVTRTLLPAGNPLWRELPLLKPLPGDELVTVARRNDPEERNPANRPQERFLVNRQGLRPGAIALGPATRSPGK